MKLKIDPDRINYILKMETSEKETLEAFNKLEAVLLMVLETYSNVHRGTGHNSMVTTALYEQARHIILEHLQLSKKNYTVFFCSPLRSRIFKSQLKPNQYNILSSLDYGLPLGVRAIAVKKNTLKKCSVIYTGGGMIKHVTSNYIVWADIPERFEAGTPNIVNVILFAAMLKFLKKPENLFKKKPIEWKKSSKEILYQDEFSEYFGNELLFQLQKSLIGNDIKVPTNEGMKKFINLDNAASTPSFLPILNAVSKTLKQESDIHKDIIKEVKLIIAKFLNAPLDKYEIIFTSNTTEAINTFARSLTVLSKKNIKSIIINTLLEHHSNELPFRYVPNAKLIRISIDDEGFINLNELKQTLINHSRQNKSKHEQVKIFAVNAVSNILGTRNNLHKISRITHEYGFKLLVDGAQIAAHHKIDISNIDIDFFVFSGHKTYAPFGTGVLVVKKDILPTFSDEIRKAGEENVIGIAALGKAVLLLERIGIDTIEKHEKNLTRISLNGLNAIKDVVIFGVKNTKSISFNNQGAILSFNLKNVPHNIAAKELAEYGGIGVRDGCFCAHLLIQEILELQQIRVLGARMTSIIFPKKTAMCLPGTLRVSFGIENNEADVKHLLKIIDKLIQKPRPIMNRLLAYTNNGTLFIPKTKTEEIINHFIKKRIKQVYST